MTLIHRIAAYGFFALFVFTTLSAMLYTVSRAELPFIPHKLMYASYITLAPFSAYRTKNHDLFIEVKGENGGWRTVDLQRYFPYRRIERLYRLHLRTSSSTEAKMARYRTMLERIRYLEEGRTGGSITAIRLVTDAWPHATETYDALRNDTFVRRTILLSLP